MSLGFIGDLLFLLGLAITIIGLLIRVSKLEKRSAETAELLAKYIKQN
ncbi:hypothetical protein NYR61_04510 [Actinobacillus genomosp. 1]|nr:hypothetical protein [Actinobacillus genomosp. 1]WGE34813.1 hypothetical protein NYR61_04510 [Actinobacillus genomosp. 1]